MTFKDTERASLLGQVRQAKADALKKKKTVAEIRTHPLLRDAIDLYCENRDNALSPAYIRKFKSIKRNQFPGIMGIQADRITQGDFQAETNRMLGKYAKKTVETNAKMIMTVVRAYGGELKLPTLGTVFVEAVDKKEFLEPSEILAFVKEARGSPRNVELLLALSSARMAEIDGLYWENVTPECAKIRQVRVMCDGGEYVLKKGAKEEASVRDIKFLIPELKEAVEERRKPEGKVMECHQSSLRKECERVCKRAGIEPCTVHALRHSYASLSAYLKIPREDSMEMGGWKNDKVMIAIYTHVFRESRAESERMFTDFFAKNKKD